MKTTDPDRLSVDLNYSAFLAENMNNKKAGIAIAESAFMAAIGDIDKLNDKNYKKSTLIMQLIRDNLTIWTTDLEEAGYEGYA